MITWEKNVKQNKQRIAQSNHILYGRIISRNVCLILFLIMVCGLSLVCEGQETELGSSAEILWDNWGVPHIYADNTEDLFYAYGYAQAHNHANRLLKLYVITRGRAAEYWGSDYADYDFWALLLDVRKKSLLCYESQSNEMKMYITAFAQGINDFAYENMDSIASEFQQILPISPQDVVEHNIYVLYSFMADPYTISEIQSYIGQSSGKITSNRSFGSNAWVIGPSHSESGKALLLANPHLAWPETYGDSDFHTFFEAHWNTPDVNAYGASILGMPFLQIAFNENLGWTHTINDADYIDFYQIELDSDGYLWNGEIEPFDISQVELKILLDDGTYYTQIENILKTVHGPVIASNDRIGIAFKTVDFGNLQIYDQYWNMCRASTFDEFEAAEKQLQIPYFNTLYADKDGHIYYLYGAMIPKRPEGDYDWSDFIPGTSSDTLWTELHSYDEIPKVIDPETGWLQNTNDQPWFCTYPQALDEDEYPSYMKGYQLSLRTQRSIELLMDDDSISFEEMIDYKHSTRMLIADRVLDDLIEAANSSGLTNAIQAAAILESWDRTADNDSVGGVLFKFWVEAMKDHFGSYMYEIPWSEDDPLNTPREIADLEAAVFLLDELASEILATSGTLSIPWGMMHRFRIDDVDLPANGASGSLGVFRTFYFSPYDSLLQKPFFGDTYVAAVEFGDTIQAKAVLGYGNASTPGSPHRTDQLVLASNKQMRDVLWNRDDVEANLESISVFNSSHVSGWELY
jgi:acyl-homoserine-lactone acylase